MEDIYRNWRLATQTWIEELTVAPPLEGPAPTPVPLPMEILRPTGLPVALPVEILPPAPYPVQLPINLPPIFGGGLPYWLSGLLGVVLSMSVPQNIDPNK